MSADHLAEHRSLAAAHAEACAALTRAEAREAELGEQLRMLHAPTADAEAEDPVQRMRAVIEGKALPPPGARIAELQARHAQARDAVPTIRRGLQVLAERSAVARTRATAQRLKQADVAAVVAKMGRALAALEDANAAGAALAAELLQDGYATSEPEAGALLCLGDTRERLRLLGDEWRGRVRAITAAKV